MSFNSFTKIFLVILLTVLFSACGGNRSTTDNSQGGDSKVDPPQTPPDTSSEGEGTDKPPSPVPPKDPPKTPSPDVPKGTEEGGEKPLEVSPEEKRRLELDPLEIPVYSENLIKKMNSYYFCGLYTKSYIIHK